VDDATMERIRHSVFDNIFNVVGDDGALEYSGERQQSRHTEGWSGPLTKQLRTLLLDHCLLDPARQQTTRILALKSRPGCKKQVEHCDSAPVGQFDHQEFFPMACVIAIEPGTRMHVRSRRTGVEVCVRLAVGDVLLFRGDVAHCGAEYERENVRLHAYIDLKRYKRPRNTTLLLTTE
jgi:hypothetical protein